MQKNPLVWFEIYVQDMDRARRFYEGVLQVTLSQLDAPDGELAMWSFPGNMETHGANGSLVKAAGMPSGGNSTIVYFHCEDCAEEAGRVEMFGGKLERAKMSIGNYGFVAHALDPDGNLIGLHSMK